MISLKFSLFDLMKSKRIREKIEDIIKIDLRLMEDNNLDKKEKEKLIKRLEILEKELEKEIIKVLEEEKEV